MTKKANSTTLTKRLLPYVLIALLTIITIAGLFGIVAAQQDRMYPNSYIGTFAVGGLTVSQAQSALKQQIPIQSDIVILINNTQYVLSSEESQISYDTDSSVVLAFSKQNSSMGTILWNSLTATYPNSQYDLVHSYNTDAVHEYLEVIKSQVEVAAIDPSVTIQKGAVIVNPGEIGETFPVNIVKDSIRTSIATGTVKPIEVSLNSIDPRINDEEVDNLKTRAETLVGKKLILTNEDSQYTLSDSDLALFLSPNNQFNEKSINDYISQKIAAQVNRSPQDAVFSIENGKVTQFLPGKEGLSVQAADLREMIVEGLTTISSGDTKELAISIPVAKESANTTTDQVNSYGIKERIGRGTSQFKGSIPGRIHNVGLAASRFNGILVAPGDVMSFNEILGDVSSLTGYKQAYVIKDGRTVLGDGGGVCQVSTTLFRAALNAGLPIIERRAHSYRVGYYEQASSVGLDATVFAPTTDFKIKNDTPHHILIQTQFDAKAATLAFELYGTSDGRLVELTKPVTTSSVAPPEDVYIDDPTLPTGKVNQVEHKAWGAKVVFDYTVTKPGEEAVKKTFVSTYRPWGAVFMRGTGPAI
jgi:vancomycin resistance protein YoaR